MMTVGDENEHEFEGEEGTFEEERLEFADEDEHLPWLEGDEDDEAATVDTGRIIGIALIGLIAVAAIVGAIWALTRNGPDPEMVADGSTIEAPEGPTKSRPEDEGGRVAEGTGDVAPQQGEGRETEGRIASGESARPSIDRRQTGESEAASGGSSASGAAASGVGVQVGAFSSRQNAETAWSSLRSRTDVLNGVRYSVVPVQVDNGTLYGLRAMAGNASEANALCRRLKGAGIDCQVKD